MNRGNVFSDIPAHVPNEICEDISVGENSRVERIVSRGQSTLKGTWLSQEKNEWVILLKGSARLLFEDAAELMVLHPGDYVTIAAHTKHRVEWTDETQDTIWLAVHYD